MFCLDISLFLDYFRDKTKWKISYLGHFFILSMGCPGAPSLTATERCTAHRAKNWAFKGLKVSYVIKKIQTKEQNTLRFLITCYCNTQKILILFINTYLVNFSYHNVSRTCRVTLKVLM